MDDFEFRQNIFNLQTSIKEEEELSSSPNSPVWPNTSDTSHLSVEDRLKLYKQKAELNTERKRQEIHQQEAANSRPFEISERTKRLLTKQTRPTRIEDRLIEEGTKRKEAAEKKENEYTEFYRAQANPVITPLASSLKREGDVVERLLQYTDIYKQKLSEKQETSSSENSQSKSYSSKLNVESRYLKSTSPKPSTEPEQHSFKPEINQRSAKLAEKLGESKERLTQKKEKQLEEETYSFQPSINKFNDSLNRKAWWEDLYSQGVSQSEKKQKLIEEYKKQKEHDPNCTFKPETYSKKGYQSQSHQERVQRLQQWNLQREKKIKEARLENSGKDLEGCTFAPKVSVT